MAGVSLLAGAVGAGGYLLTQLGGLPWSPASATDVVAIATAVMTVLLALAATVHLVPGPPVTTGPRTRGAAAAGRERARRRRVPRACDPDARGHRRPRAPSVIPSAG
jgi:hypothetical protein